MKHQFVYVTGPHGQLIRACTNCICSAVYVSAESRWVPITESDKAGSLVLGTEDCLSDEETKPAVKTKSGFAAVDAKAREVKKVTVDCYCEKCRGKKSHYPDASNCYCASCKGRKPHYDA